jgi:putative DNA primase/helicase
MADSVLEYALKYIAKGWRVLPLYTIRDGRCTCPGSKECKAGKHPHFFAPNGSINATSDEKKVRQWFGSDIAVNIGIAAGIESGLVLLDIDPDHGGMNHLSNLKVFMARCQRHLW